MNDYHAVSKLSDAALLAGVRALVAKDCDVTAHLLAHLGEMEARGLYRDCGCENMFTYCVEVLHFSEAAAANRRDVANAAREVPLILEYVADGRVHLTGIRRLRPHLNAENARALLDACSHKSTREIEALLAARAPKADVRDMVRKLPAATVKAEPMAVMAQHYPRPPLLTTPTLATPRSEALEPLSATRHKITFTAESALLEKLDEATALLSTQFPGGHLEDIFEAALDALIAQRRKRKFAEVEKPRAASPDATPQRSGRVARQVPAAIRRAVAKRDQYRCTFVAPDGRACSATHFLEYHHEEPFARNASHSERGIRLLCRAHNQLLAERDFGKSFMKAKRGRSPAPPSARAERNGHL